MTLVELASKFDDPFDLVAILESAKNIGIPIPDGYTIEDHKSALSEAGINHAKTSRGFGDTIAKITSAVGIKPCGGCKQRQETLNNLFPYKQD